ncbi:OmpA family protein [Aureisphaera galaxeae]|uniref:OmpA family protein n=1 Tax=Aureisphaera galaxeae TaxID=1538023 RepID=UPI0023500DF4|nr:OmpA family protein [Aureisphaera galaxeae]MDC8004384.1 OmpA family protein [Aureisphaera galaxeae]
MKNFLTALLVFLVWSFFGLWLFSILDPVHQNTNPPEEVASTSTDTVEIDEGPITDESLEPIEGDSLNRLENEVEPFDSHEQHLGLKAITPKNDVIFLFNQGIGFHKNSSDIILNEEVKDFKYKLNTYMISHPNEELHICSLYSASEDIHTPNWGFQRGQKVKELLLETGMAREKIVIKPIIREINFDENGRHENGISFSFSPLDEARIAEAALKLPEDKTIYPKLVNNDIFVNKDLQDLLAEVKEAMAANPNLIVEVVGHTDNVGNANDNYLVGLKHARQVRWYLVTKGKLDRKKIIARSEGESKSIASNKTERGRLLNRRIEIKYSSS